ncbi:hydroxyectoine utilization dehydratase EutB [Mesorhizobium sp. M4B.F.Ca.ET.190.01.1.1]|uniref:hydroxyectoine utilization dehydratase EutB n=1 Tax=unclassified Mesorhizobium TaxID=325217 RepID=UPI001091C91A|nr:MULTISPECIES: hydroxyectoine utilization dehydratase EutB [unclassified Mesorhizobium]TGR15152.1 hydroxyectoine utilization dehydratase EutB [Mesorhizobium sp. M4B.F.Ca.ET.200.01.1.1]TGS23026.1 hydroxyectoine utilization dehydratase EutB [Mesorhizobium sp. M4B.F.Ca.ET.190.01.1.1]TGT33862.1 hydroxyectoine utilization dehydratase EutB [Mesorhizobium sp. M4B.F.Ca.ET.172.01.1.1]
METRINKVAFEDIVEARARILSHVFATPLVTSPTLSNICGVAVSLKLEHYQATGSFKLRGATNAILQLSAAGLEKGVVAASTGNHGRALAYAARAAGSRATICMSRLVPENKVAEIRRLGAEVRIIGNSHDDAQAEADRISEQQGLTAVPPFDHPHVVAGQGTIGIEIVEAMPSVTTIVVPLSGGGLIAGVAAAAKALRPRVKVIGVSMHRGAAMKASLDAGRPVLVEEFASLADSLGGGIGLDNGLTFSMCRDLLDGVVLLTESEIADGMRHAYAHEREILEGSGAVGIAALLARKIPDLVGPLAVVLSGRNIDMELHRRVMNGERDPFGGDV